ncbi:hypothetical protein [Paenarthrobacter sp. NPDC058040]|uniref:hypothetical protein n=1 Tax=unclassified Paenarthrobacter TaxID=2634190 RepID=UPI0036D7BC7F
MAKRAPGRYPEGKASPKPVFAAFLIEQAHRPDTVGDLAREAQATQFEGSTVSDMWEHLERLDGGGTIRAMTQAEREKICWFWTGRSAGKRIFMRDVLISAACPADDDADLFIRAEN